MIELTLKEKQEIGDILGLKLEKNGEQLSKDFQYICQVSVAQSHRAARDVLIQDNSDIIIVSNHSLKNY